MKASKLLRRKLLVSSKMKFVRTTLELVLLYLFAVAGLSDSASTIGNRMLYLILHNDSSFAFLFRSNLHCGILEPTRSIVCLSEQA